MLNELQIEMAARKLCELRGIDPDWPTSVGLSPLDWSWKRLIPEIRAAEQVREAIAYTVAESQRKAFDEVMATPFCPPPGLCECGHSHANHVFAKVNDEFITSCRETRCNCRGYFEAKR